MGNVKVKADELVDAIYELSGNVTAVAKRFGVSRRTIYNRLDKLSTARQALEEARCRRVEAAKDRLAELVHAEDENVALGAIRATIKNYDPEALRSQGVNVSTKEDGTVDQININLVE